MPLVGRPPRGCAGIARHGKRMNDSVPAVRGISYLTDVLTHPASVIRYKRPDCYDLLGSGGHAEWARRWHRRDQEMLLLLGHIQGHHETVDANELAIQRQDLATERRNNFAVALNRLHLRQRLPRHHALQLG